MNNFIYENRTKVYFGQGCVKEFLTCLLRDYDTVMMAYGQGSVKRNGIYDEILNILMKEGKNVVEFSGIMPNPTYEKVLEGAALARDRKRVQRRRCHHQRGVEDKDRLRLPEVQSQVCPDGPCLHLQRAWRAAGGGRL